MVMRGGDVCRERRTAHVWHNVAGERYADVVCDVFLFWRGRWMGGYDPKGALTMPFACGSEPN